jgi:protein-tyrosine-phosphatase
VSAPFRILILCTGNSARSQIAEAILTIRGAGRIEAGSAGSHPAAQVHPLAVRTLAARGIDWIGHMPKGLGQATERPWDLLITVCDDANESCPFVPGTSARVHWGLPDPAAAQNSDAVAAFDKTYWELDRRIEALLTLPLETMEQGAMVRAAQWVHVFRTRT